VKGIDHYIAMDMTAFKNMVDAIGGIDIYVPYYIDLNQGQDGANPNYVYYPGSYHVDGERALMFARLRAETTIFQRARYQDIILRGLQHSLLSPWIIPELPNLVSQLSGAVKTDLSPSEIQQLICLAEKLNDDTIRIVQFPDNIFTGQSTYDPYRNVNTYTLAVDENVIRSYFANFMQGTWPDSQ
jgi:anionic cell wall polymer biosynthesis LytR-Cps2A-Psr (LCP) family protein